MKTIAAQSRQALQLIAHAPSIGVVSFVYSGLIQAASIRADLLDIANPWWIVTIGLILLLSPLYHMVVIGKVAAILSKQSFSWRALPIEAFAALVAGELLVNAGVIAGSAAFLLPGIYLGLRAVYYKQAIILHKARALAGIQQSFRMTAPPRVMLQILLMFSVSYCIPLAVDFLVMPAMQSLWVHVIAILVSTGFVAWINVYVTISFYRLVDSNESAECP